MTSGFVDPYRRFGIPLTHEELEKVNIFRTNNNRDVLTSTPGLILFRHGKNNEGYWNYKHFHQQLIDVMDVVEVLYEGYQIVIEVDQSSGHMKYEDDALLTSNLNVNWGGSQPRMKDSIIENLDYLGPHSRTLSVGDIQKMYFDDESTGPFDEIDRDGTKYDRPYTEEEMFRLQSTWRGKKPMPTIRQGWLNKPKGLKQLLWERGLYQPRLNKSQMQMILSRLPDFSNEKIGIRNLLQERGHILVVSPKCHPEIAGSGIEYSWGLADIHFRNIISKTGAVVTGI